MSAVAGVSALGATVVGVGAGATGVGVYNREKIGNAANTLAKYVKSGFVAGKKVDRSSRLSGVVKVPEEKEGFYDSAKRFGGGVKRLGGYVQSRFSGKRANVHDPLEEVTEDEEIQRTEIPAVSSSRVRRREQDVVRKEEIRQTRRQRAMSQESRDREQAMEQERRDLEQAMEQERRDREQAMEQERRDREQAMEQERRNSEEIIQQENRDTREEPMQQGSRESRVTDNHLRRSRSFSPSARVVDKRPFDGVDGPSRKRTKVADGNYVPGGRKVGADPAKVEAVEEELKKEGSGTNDLMLMMMMMQQIQSATSYSDRGISDSYVPSQLSSYRMHTSDLTL